MNFLYTIVIFPLVQIIELCYIFVYRVFHNPGVALFGVSIAVSVLTLPLYLRAKKWQETERKLQKHLAPKIAKIKAVFKGDEQYMMLSTYYRQNHYHPIYAMRNTFGLLIQIPFFIAVYSFLSNLKALQGSPFLFIRDLGAPDALFSIGRGTIPINILPVAMTVINCISGAVYTKGLAIKDKVQIYGMAVIFLALLYNSPSGLVLYWTMNNIFSLLKNIVIKTKHAKKWIYGILFATAAFLDIYVMFLHDGYIVKRIVVFTFTSLVFFLPLFKRLYMYIIPKIHTRVSLYETALYKDYTFIFSILIIFMLAGIVIPGLLIVSSVSEFSFIEDESSPFVYVYYTIIQSAGLFLFWPCCIYFLFSKKIKIFLNYCISVLCIMALINVFIFPGNYGFLTSTMILSDPGSYRTNFKLIVINIVFLFLIVVILFFILTTRRRLIFFTVQIIISMSCFGLSFVNVVKIYDEYALIEKKNEKKILTPVYNLSKERENVVVIMLDRAISAFVPYIFAENKNVASLWIGFTWYPNCVSFGPFTIYGIPALTGGYEYTVLEMQDNPKALAEKHNEALLLLPIIFNKKGFITTITDPSWSNYAFAPDLSIFENYPYIHAENITASYTGYWLAEHSDIQVISVSNILKTRLERFSFFKMAPPVLRTFIYDRGDWLITNDREIREDKNELSLNALGKYAALDYLPEITKIDSETGTYTIIFNELTHDPFFLQAPFYIPENNITDKGTGKYADDPHYHVDVAAFLLLGKWFAFLKENNVYDNTRIIIVSDHGWNIPLTEENNIILPDGNYVTRYNALLMVKDFNADGILKSDYRFMTQADVPVLVLEGLVDNPLNPFTGKAVRTDKEGGVTITTSNKFYPTNHGKYGFNIGRNEWLHVRDNIFDPANWEKVKK
ncbi:MAG: membrane protein insertase YidC [Spirochaetaceae bacterium]|nr:membrane protein insertase YidC [Spirochaetaceae bacterium]